MKKIMLAFTLVAVLGVSAQQQPPQQSPPAKVMFYYYPSSNVYYNPTNKEYWYYDDGSTNWMEVETLPTTITLVKSPKYTVYYQGEDVWKDNATHKKKYKAKDNGKTKEKPKS